MLRFRLANNASLGSGMEVFRGRTISGGKGYGRIVFVDKLNSGHADNLPSPSILVSDKEEQYSNFKSAQKRVADDFDALILKMKSSGQKDMSDVFEAQRLLVCDVTFSDLVREAILQDGLDSVSAVKRACEEIVSSFEATGDEVLIAKSEDIRDVCKLICEKLDGNNCASGTGAADFADMTGGADSSIYNADNNSLIVIATKEILLSDFMKLEHSRICGVVMAHGSAYSHLAVLLKALGIPAICGVNIDFSCDGQMALVDGDAGTITIGCREDIEKEMGDCNCCGDEHVWSADLEKGAGQANLGKRTVTTDSRLRIACNISMPSEVAGVIEAGVYKIGLFRSEFIFLAADKMPSEDEQFEAYKEVASKMGGKEVVIRTADFGADKMPDYFSDFVRESKFDCMLEGSRGNDCAKGTAKDLRGIRLSLKYPEVFRTQLRAIYRASAFGNISIMFPMVTSVGEFEEGKRICDETAAQLKSEGVDISGCVKIGVMVETPEAVSVVDELCAIADFISIGTNDLTHLILGCDRESGEMLPNVDKALLHPAVMQAIRKVADAARRAGKSVSICGEIAAEPALYGEFADMGIDELSMNLPSVRNNSCLDGKRIEMNTI